MIKHMKRCIFTKGGAAGNELDDRAVCGADGCLYDGCV